MIDWYSFTYTIGEGVFVSYDEFLTTTNAVVESLARASGGLRIIDVFAGRRHSSRAPYRFGLASMQNDVFVHASPLREELLFEISGAGCDRLRRTGILENVIEQTYERATRIDLAVDIETALDPRDFIAEGHTERFKTKSVMTSAKGITCYVGSMKSDLYARVYRYFMPHPRSHLLRIEHVFRRSRARIVAEALVQGADEVTLAARALATFGWRHPIAGLALDGAQALPAEPSHRSSAGRLWWLYNQVAPALAQALVENSLDWDHYMQHVEKLIDEIVSTGKEVS